MAMLRLPAATEFLLEIVATEGERIGVGGSVRTDDLSL